jgi:hypothetical protein
MKPSSKGEARQDRGNRKSEGREGCDGFDPRYDDLIRRSEDRRNKPDYASLRLCARIRETILLDEHLSEFLESDLFQLESVSYSGRGETYTVVFANTESASQAEAREFIEFLERRKGALRHEIAASVNRKRAPDLQFMVLPPGAHHED